MSQPRPPLIDPVALARNRRRARPDAASFVLDAARDEIQQRLVDVNRTFTSPALITPYPTLWADLWPGASRIAPQETLAIAPGAHDLVVHAMALHWAEDPVGQIIQAARALRPDGLLLAICLGGETLHELRAALAQAETETRGGLSPRVAPMAEIRDLGHLLQRAGLALPVADTVRLRASYPSMAALVRDLRAMGETNALAGRERRPTPRRLFDRAEAMYRAAFPAGPGRIAATFDLMCLTGWAPHASQQKPLRPGSAKARLSDALRVPEFDETGAALAPPAPEER